MYTIVTRQNQDGSFDTVGMNNRVVLRYTLKKTIVKWALKWAPSVKIEYYTDKHAPHPFEVVYITRGNTR